MQNRNDERAGGSDPVYGDFLNEFLAYAETCGSAR